MVVLGTFIVTTPFLSTHGGRECSSLDDDYHILFKTPVIKFGSIIIILV